MIPAVDRLALAVAGVFLLGAVGWFVAQAREVEAIRARPVPLPTIAVGYETRAVELPRVENRRWNAPEYSEVSAGWVFDTFTPPVIYYHRLTGRFTVTPPDYSTLSEDSAATSPKFDFGIELVEIQTLPFRLQLVGYAGGPGNYLGMFENVPTGETLLARSGRVLADLNLQIREVWVQREEIATPDSMPLVQTVARARVWDERTGEEIWLSSDERRVTGQPLARLRLNPTGEERWVGLGDELQLDTRVFVLEGLSLNPPAVEVRVDEADQPSLRRQLVPVSPSAPPPTRGFSPDSPPLPHQPRPPFAP